MDEDPMACNASCSLWLSSFNCPLMLSNRDLLLIVTRWPLSMTRWLSLRLSNVLVMVTIPMLAEVIKLEFLGCGSFRVAR